MESYLSGDATLILSLLECKYYDKAHHYIRRGIAQDNLISYRYLAYCYENGYGVKKNIKEAFIYYKEAALKDDYISLLRYAELGVEGYGKKEDIDILINKLLMKNIKK